MRKKSTGTRMGLDITISIKIPPHGGIFSSMQEELYS